MSNDTPKKAALTSMDIVAQKRAGLKRLFPEVFVEGEIDFAHLDRVLGRGRVDKNARKERFGLNWPGKTACMKIIQQPSIATLKPARAESVNFDETENLFIEGDNLEVLKLLQKAYFGKVKMIYIDPPYNTGKEFIYPDKHSETLATYLAYTGQTDDEGRRLWTGPKTAVNAENSGRFHSRWLNMMYPRLYLARNLLREDGLFFVSIGEDEFSNLKQIMDEVMGEDNYVGAIMWNSTKSVTSTALISNAHTYNLVFAKNKDYFKANRNHFRLPESGQKFANPDNDPRGPWTADPFQVGGWRPNQQYEIVNPKTGKVYKPLKGNSWKNDHEKFKKLLDDNRIVFGVKGEAGPQRKRFLSEAMERGRVAKTWWDDVGTTTNGTAHLKSLFNGVAPFDNPKPVDLVERMIALGDHTGEGIILDFFAGSATTGEAVLSSNKKNSKNRKFILAQLPENIDSGDKDMEPVVKFCEGAGIERNIAALARERLKRAIGNSAEQGFRAFRLDRSNFKVWQGDAEQLTDERKLAEQLAMHVDHIDKASAPEDILYELLLKAGHPLDTKVEQIKLAGKKVYAIEGGKLLICLEKAITAALIDAIAEAAPTQVICLDAAFHGNDQLKTNAVQTFKSMAESQESEIVFRTV